MLKYIIYLLILLSSNIVSGQSIVGDVLRLKPSALPAVCVSGDVRIDAGDSNTPKVCVNGTWEPFGDNNTYTYEGFSARFNEDWDSDGIDDTFQKIIDIQYTAPLVSLSASGASTLREKGATVTSTTLTATVTKRSDPIAEVRFFQGSSLISQQTSGGAIPNGGNSTYAWTGSFSDNTTFSVEVDDNGATGGPTTVTSSTTFSFVYPYYVGAGPPGLTASQVAALTKRIINSTASRTETIAAGAGEVFYFAYPASYGALASILDVNNFETFNDWTLTTSNITGLDSNPVSYRIYSFDNPVVAGSYTYTFRR